jgi:hypothetical protein
VIPNKARIQSLSAKTMAAVGDCFTCCYAAHEHHVWIYYDDEKTQSKQPKHVRRNQEKEAPAARKNARQNFHRPKQPLEPPPKACRKIKSEKIKSDFFCGSYHVHQTPRIKPPQYSLRVQLPHTRANPPAVIRIKAEQSIAIQSEFGFKHTSLGCRIYSS